MRASYATTTPQLKAKRTALDDLKDHDTDFFEWRIPPNAVPMIIERMGADLANLRKLVRKELMVREVSLLALNQQMAQI